MIDMLINLFVIVVNKFGFGYLLIEFLSISLVIFMFYYIRKTYNSLKQEHFNQIKKISELDRALNNKVNIILGKLDELDPISVHEKLDKFREDLEDHKGDEVRTLHDIHNLVTKIDTKIHLRNHLERKVDRASSIDTCIGDY
jgi:hypothetical protein